MSLLCQLFRLNETIQEIKTVSRERANSETLSEDSTHDPQNTDLHDEAEEDYLYPNPTEESNDEEPYLEPVPIRPPRKSKWSRSNGGSPVITNGRTHQSNNSLGYQLDSF